MIRPPVSSPSAKMKAHPVLYIHRDTQNLKRTASSAATDGIEKDNKDSLRSLLALCKGTVLQASPQCARRELLLNSRAFRHPGQPFRALSGHHAQREDGGPAAERPLVVPAFQRRTSV